MALKKDQIIEMFSLTNVPSQSLVDDFADEFTGAAPGAFLQLAGGTMAGDIDMDANSINNLSAITFQGAVGIFNAGLTTAFLTGNGIPAGTSIYVRLGTTQLELKHTGEVLLATPKIGFFTGTIPKGQPGALAAISAAAINTGDAGTDTVIENIRTVVNAMKAALNTTTGLGLFAG